MDNKQGRSVTITSEVQVEHNLLYSIGKAAEMLNLTMRAIRLYCEKGLISERRLNGARYFRAHEVMKLSLVTQGKILDLSLQEIARFMVDRSDTGHGPALVVPEHLVEQQVETLRQRNEAMLAIIGRSVLHGPEQPTAASQGSLPKIFTRRLGA